MASGIRMPRVALTLLFWFFFQGTVCFWNWWWFIKWEVNILGQRLVDTHLAFNLLGALQYIFLFSPLLFWPYRYANQMTARSRRNSMMVCVYFMYFLHDLPLWMMEFYIVWRYGWMTSLQATSMLLLTFSAAFGTFAVWLTYAWKMSKFLQSQYGTALHNAAGVSEAALRQTRFDPSQRI